MQGMGGIGKSVLAAALARNRQVRQSYPDGIAWISCGQNLAADALLNCLRDLVRHLGGDDTFQSLPQGQGVLRELLQAKAVLLVLDDVWQATDAKTFTLPGIAIGNNFTFVNNGADGAVLVTISPNSSDGITYAGSETDDKDLLNTKATAIRGDYAVISAFTAVVTWQAQCRGIWAKQG